MNDSDFDPETLLWERKFINGLSKAPVMDLDSRLRAVERQLALVSPKEEDLVRYPALKQAYDEFRLVHAIVTGIQPKGE